MPSCSRSVPPALCRMMLPRQPTLIVYVEYIRSRLRNVPRNPRFSPFSSPQAMTGPEPPFDTQGAKAPECLYLFARKRVFAGRKCSCTWMLRRKSMVQKAPQKMRPNGRRCNSCERSLSPQVHGRQAIEAGLPCGRTKCPMNRTRQRASECHSNLNCIVLVSFAQSHLPDLRRRRHWKPILWHNGLANFEQGPTALGENGHCRFRGARIRIHNFPSSTDVPFSTDPLS